MRNKFIIQGSPFASTLKKPQIYWLISVLSQAILLLSISSNVWSTNQGYILDTSLGTDGIGIGIEKPISERWSLSLRVTSLSYDGDYEANDTDYEADLSQHSINTLIHWYPFNNGFQTTFGITSIQGDYILEASGEESYELGSETYEGTLNLRSRVNISRVNPYVGIGWRNRSQGSGLGIGVDLGAVWLSDLDLDMTASGTVSDSSGSSINISADTEFLNDLQAEEDALEADIKDFIFPWVPVGRFYVDYRF